MKKVIVLCAAMFILSCNTENGNSLSPISKKEQNSWLSNDRKDFNQNHLKIQKELSELNVDRIYEISQTFSATYSEESYYEGINQLNATLNLNLEADFEKFNAVNQFLNEMVIKNPSSLLENLDPKYIDLGNKLSQCFKDDYQKESELESDLDNALAILTRSNTTNEYKLILEIKLRKLINEAKVEIKVSNSKGAKISSDKPKCKLKDIPCLVLHFTTLSGGVFGWYLLFNTQSLQVLINTYGWDYIVQCCFCSCACPAGCPSLIGHAYN